VAFKSLQGEDTEKCDKFFLENSENNNFGAPVLAKILQKNLDPIPGVFLLIL
jgi:hypothetical protein